MGSDAQLASQEKGQITERHCGFHTKKTSRITGGFLACPTQLLCLLPGQTARERRGPHEPTTGAGSAVHHLYNHWQYLPGDVPWSRYVGFMGGLTIMGQPTI